MWAIWVFWVEILAFAGYVLWSLRSDAVAEPLRWFQFLNLAIYGAALAYGFYGFLRFAGRRIGGFRTAGGKRGEAG